MASSKKKTETVRSFVRRQITADEAITDDQIFQNWKALYGAVPLSIKYTPGVCP